MGSASLTPRMKSTLPYSPSRSNWPCTKAGRQHWIIQLHIFVVGADVDVVPAGRVLFWFVLLLVVSAKGLGPVTCSLSLSLPARHAGKGSVFFRQKKAPWIAHNSSSRICGSFAAHAGGAAQLLSVEEKVSQNMICHHLRKKSRREKGK